MTKKYPIILYPVERDGRTSYSVLVPDLPGCVSYGDTQQEALESARAAIDLQIQALIENGDPVPEPSSVDQISDKDEPSAIYALVEIPLSEVREKALSRKSTRINLTFPGDLLREVDEYCEQTGFARSKFFQVLTERFLRGVSSASELEQAKRALHDTSWASINNLYARVAERMETTSLQDKGASDWRTSCDAWLKDSKLNANWPEESLQLFVYCLIAGFRSLKESRTDKDLRGEPELFPVPQKSK
jgi:predicted RNase H-like HicB family nuclease